MGAFTFGMSKEEVLQGLGEPEVICFQGERYTVDNLPTRYFMQFDSISFLIVGDAVGLATLDMGEGIGPAIRSGLLAAEAILHDSDYDVRTIPRVSLLPSLRRLVAAR